MEGGERDGEEEKKGESARVKRRGEQGRQEVPKKQSISSISTFSPCLEVILQQLSLCLPTAMGQNSAVLCIYLLNITWINPAVLQRVLLAFRPIGYSFLSSLPFFLAFPVQVQPSFTFYSLLYSILLLHYLLKNVFLMCFMTCFINKLLKNIPAASDHLININKAIPDEAIIKSVAEHPC